jgi:hypothetical protein
MNKVKEAGIGWVRIDVSWDEIESQQGSFEWYKSDDPITAASDRGLQILANLNGTPKWANGGKAPSIAPNNASDWASFCREAALRYDGNHGLPKITTFGIWNEPDGSGLGERGASQDSKLKSYVDVILKPCSQAIRSVRSDARLAGPELASEPEFLSKMLAQGKEALDIVTVHAYSDLPNGVMKKLDSFRTAMKQNGVDASKELWLTETGWSTQTPRGCWFGMVDDNTQAGRTTDLLKQLADKAWVQKVFLYELMDDDNPGACQWGLLRSNLSEKPAFRAYRDFISAQTGSGGGGGGGVAIIPNGSYRQSCKDIVATPTVLTARCKNIQGRLESTSLANPGQCVDGIDNINGKLQCQIAIPNGSYRQSCKDVVATSSSLMARCKDRRGNFRQTTLQNPAECRKDISNDDGNLRCQ